MTAAVRWWKLLWLGWGDFFEKVEENEKNEEIFAISDKNMLNELSV